MIFFIPKGRVLSIHNEIKEKSENKWNKLTINLIYFRVNFIFF